MAARPKPTKPKPARKPKPPKPADPTPPTAPRTSRPTLQAAGLAALVLALAVMGYREARRQIGPDPAPPPAPAPGPADPTAARLGTAYLDALDTAARGMLEAVASSSPESTAALTDAQRRDFAGRLTAAWAPVAAELETRFGPASADPLDPTKAAAVRAFYAAALEGARAHAPAN